MKLLIKVSGLLLITLLKTVPTLAQSKFHPELSFITGYTNTQSDNQANQGEFLIKHSTVNFGFSVTNKFEFKNNYFFNTGIRYNNYKTSIQIANPPDYVYITSDSYSWIQRFEAITIPVNFGKNVLLFNKIPFELYAGGSIGVFLPASSTYTDVGTYSKNINQIKPPFLFYDNTTSSNLGIFPTADLGFCMQPFRRNARLRFGVHFSSQLNRTFETRYRRELINTANNQSTKYDLTLKQQYTSANLTFGYRFYKKKKTLIRPTFNPLES